MLFAELISVPLIASCKGLGSLMGFAQTPTWDRFALLSEETSSLYLEQQRKVKKVTCANSEHQNQFGFLSMHYGEKSTHGRKNAQMGRMCTQK